MHDDTLNEDHELFTMTLRNPAHAVLTGGGAELTATGRIENDDGLPALSIEHARLTEGEGAMRFTVTLAPASGRTVTVHYATADAGAEAATDYTTVTGALTFEAGATTHTISVPVVDDEADEADEKFTVTLSSPVRARLAVATATATITDNDESAAQPQLTALQVTGGGTMYPPFDPDTHHYALTCSNSTTLEVSAKAAPSGAVLTLLRANSDDNHASTGALEAQAEVNRNDDVAIELSAGGDTVTYVMHCLPPNFPDIRGQRQQPLWNRGSHRLGAAGDDARRYREVLLELMESPDDPPRLPVAAVPGAVCTPQCVSDRGERWGRRRRYRGLVPRLLPGAAH